MPTWKVALMYRSRALSLALTWVSASPAVRRFCDRTRSIRLDRGATRWTWKTLGRPAVMKLAPRPTRITRPAWTIFKTVSVNFGTISHEGGMTPNISSMASCR